jgi:hypothetical protein
MKRPNPLNPNLMKPIERRAALCSLLALGLVRLRMKENGEPSDEIGENSLHFPHQQNGSPDANYRRPA